MTNQVNLASLGFGGLPADYFSGKSGLNYRFYVAEDVIKMGVCPPVKYDDESRTFIYDLYDMVDRAALYVHVPWCVEKCTYCYYWGRVEAKTEMQRLFEAEKGHAKLIDAGIDLKNKDIPTIYFGGGTPTVLPVELLGEYLDFFVGGFANANDTEVCCEASISSLTKEKIEVMRKYVTRLSLGVQTFSDNLLKAVARSFDAAQAKEVIKEAVLNFDSVNIDLIYGLRNQTMKDWIDTVEQAILLEVPSATLYRLEIRVPTMMKEYDEDARSFPDEISCREMRHRAKQLLEQAGYRENLVGWFVKPRVKDTVVYRERWARQTPCIAFGPGVHNYGSDYFYYNVFDKEDYIKRANQGRLPILNIHRMRNKEQLLWFVMAQWKSNLPVYLDDIKIRFGDEAGNYFQAIVKDFAGWGMVSISDNVFSLTEGGKSILEWMIRDMLHQLTPTVMDRGA
jgi:oxygen-independent coproporphyrinogen-3 oxidase